MSTDNASHHQQYTSPYKKFEAQSPSNLRSPGTQKKVGDYGSPGVESSMLTRSTLERELEELRIRLETRYIDEIEKWKARFLEADSARSLLEKDNILLHSDLDNAINKIGDLEHCHSHELALKESVHNQERDNLRKSAMTETHLKNFENDRLRNQLADRAREIDLWKSRCANAEQAALSAQEGEHANHQLSIKIKQLMNELQDKVCEINALKRRILDLEQLNSQQVRMEAQIKDLRVLLDFKTREFEKLKAEKADTQLDLYRTKAREDDLKRRNKTLDDHRERLEKSIIEQEQGHKAKVEELEDMHKSTIQQHRDEYEKEKKSLHATAIGHETEKNELKKTLNYTEGELENARKAHDLAKSEIDEWQGRHRQKEGEIEDLKKSHHEILHQTTNDHQEEKKRFLNHIDVLNENMNQKQSQLQETQSKLNETEEQRQNLHQERGELQGQVEAWRSLSAQKEKEYHENLKMKESQHKQQQENLAQRAQQEKNQLDTRINVLNNLLDQKRQEVEHERLNSVKARSEAIEKARLAQQKEAEANVWRHRADQVEREKSLELIANEECNRSRIEQMRRAHEAERHVKDHQNDSLRRMLIQKDDELCHTKSHVGMSLSQLAAARAEASKYRTDAEVYKHQLTETEKKKNLELAVTQDLSRQQIERERRNNMSENFSLRSQVRELSNEVERKSRQLVMTESLSNSRLIEERRLHNLEESHLQRHLHDLHHELHKKEHEADDWKTRFFVSRRY